jgi:hypothetical protein
MFLGRRIFSPRPYHIRTINPGNYQEIPVFFFRCKNGGFPEGGVITEKGGEHYRKERWVDWFIYMCMGCTGRRYLE